MADQSRDKPRRRKQQAAPQADTELGDPAVLAERFLDLWQDQIAALATDPDVAEQVARLWSQWLIGPTAWRPPVADSPPSARAATRPAKPARHHDAAAQAADREAPVETAGEAPRAAPAAAAPGHGGADVGHLLARLSTLEKRLAALERPAHGRSGSAARRARRR
jgi:hypothetical protein